ncbi:NAD-binding domain 4 protein [Aspergillus clavatus NRRL 1]|uniref:gluconokinase n=1 Tax=Aspergillus clavatus (strain ATCC 1007 / CBS 513.65 / DSM 816 / NCTC 3887 / NRRL 1 / QM 1276 / 107) TaxID=344612 RepID=A1CC18_ASPCL|nr:NAD-binding domain 4 protein [Aspergillus clavatus NRRL 1]EAW13286.1 NAD-binding domain 4 protein [Aspergillus clavatus NRRL 1]
MAESPVPMTLGKKMDVEEQMAALIDKYSGHFKSHEPQEHPADGEYVVITDATSTLGVHLVAQLVRMKQVRTVFCLVRTPSKYMASFEVQCRLLTHGLWYDISVEDGKKIIAFPADLSNPHLLGMGDDAYGQLRRFATVIIHCDWMSDPNAPLASFEWCIASTRRLLDLCLDTERPELARFCFCSSVRTVMHTLGDVAPEALPGSFSCADYSGDAQSKLVAEHIVHRAGQGTKLRTCVVRTQENLGDLSFAGTRGDDSVADILREGKKIHALPSLDATIKWDRADVIATSVIQLTLSPNVTGIFNVVNPTFIHWGYGLLPLLHRFGSQFQILSVDEWEHRLRESTPNRTTSLKLELEECDGHGNTEFAYDTRKAQAYAPALRQGSGLDEQAVTRLLADLDLRLPGTSVSLLDTHRTVFILAGPSGCGKSTTGKDICERFKLPMIEGDDIHSPASRRKMANRIPLTDDDRWGWLAHLRGAVMNRLQNTEAPGIVVTCSALRTVYRDQLRHLSRLFDEPVQVVFLMLSIRDGKQLQDRLEKRSTDEGHYMSSTMVPSQLQVFEDPDPLETDVIVVNAARPKEVVLENVMDVVNEILSLPSQSVM